MPPHRLYNHKIKLEGEVNYGFSPLYNILTLELIILKKYLVKNLNKGFIKASQAPFTSSILFAKKPNSGLRFYIDFHKLNAIT